jgi:PilZ domain
MGKEMRRSDRVVPVILEEEVVLVDIGTGAKPVLAKMLDFSEVGTLVYLLINSELEPPVGGACTLTMYDQGHIFSVPSIVARKTGRMIAFDFSELSEINLRNIQSKLIRMEVEWLRLSKPAG